MGIGAKVEHVQTVTLARAVVCLWKQSNHLGLGRLLRRSCGLARVMVSKEVAGETLKKDRNKDTSGRGRVTFSMLTTTDRHSQVRRLYRPSQVALS